MTMTKNGEEDGKEETKTYDFKIVGITEEPSRDWIQDQSIYIDDSMKDEIFSFANMNEEEGSREEVPYSEVLVYAPSIEKVAA